jgi:hypothetical protein
MMVPLAQALFHIEPSVVAKHPNSVPARHGMERLTVASSQLGHPSSAPSAPRSLSKLFEQ